MNRTVRGTRKALLTIALLGAGIPALFGGDQPAEKPGTLEEQLACLDAALKEALQDRDWRMLTLAAEGYKAIGLKGADLLLHVLTAQRDAALGRFAPRGQVLAWGLGCRALAGDAKAKEELWAAARVQLAPAVTPSPPKVPATAGERLAQAKAQEKHQREQEKAELRSHSLLCLGLLKDPESFEVAMRCIQEATGPFAFQNTQVLAQAALAANPAEAWSRLLGLAIQQAQSATAGLPMLFHQLSGMLSQGAAGQWNSFTVEGLIHAGLPRDARAQFAQAFKQLLKNAQAAEKDKGYPQRIQGWISAAMCLTKEERDEETMDLLAELKAKSKSDQNLKWIANSIQQLESRLGEQSAERREVGDPKPGQPAQPQQVPAPQPGPQAPTQPPHEPEKF